MQTQDITKAEAEQHSLVDGAITLGPVSDEWSWYTYEEHYCDYWEQPDGERIGCPEDCDIDGTITKETYETRDGRGLWQEVPAGWREVEPGRYETAYYEWKQILGTTQYTWQDRRQLIREYDREQGEYGTTYRNTPRIPKKLLF